MAAAEDRAIRSVAVAGAGITGLCAALAFARALPKTKVTLVALPPDPAALTDRLPATLPTVHMFHAAIGFDELDLVKRGIAIHRLGTVFENWSADGSTWIHAFGGYGLPAGNVPFHRIWASARREGRGLAFDRYSAAALLAEAGKFVHPSGDPDSPLSNLLYGLFLDPARYRSRLEESLAAMGVERIEGAFGGAERRGDGGLAALILADGRRVEADLFLDCAGPSAPLLSALDPPFEDWSEWLPVEQARLVAGPAHPAGPVPSDTVTASAEGWRWHVPLPDGTMTGFFSGSRGSKPEGDAPAAHDGMVRIRPGRCSNPWVANVLALGDASAALDPLHAANLHLAQMGILRALELLPGRDCHPLELREYNRRAGQESIRVRDFLALHYFRSGRREGAFWEAMSDREPPETLAHTLEQFEARGRLPFYEDETFTADSWTAALLGMGVTPRAIDPVTAGIAPESAAAGMDSLAARLSALRDRVPGYGEYLAGMVRSTEKPVAPRIAQGRPGPYGVRSETRI